VINDTLLPGHGLESHHLDGRKVIIGKAPAPNDAFVLIQLFRPPTKEDISYSTACGHQILTTDGHWVLTSFLVSESGAEILLMGLAEILNRKVL